MTIRDLDPSLVWKNFYALTQIPRPSKKEGKAVEYLYGFGKSLGLETIKDEVGNIIIKKPATPGMEGRRGVILQGHIDMVPQKNADKVHDFEKDPITTLVDGDWVRADGTTLGADNGLGVAVALSVLESRDLKHGPVEVLVTVDEETGMTGANALKPGLLDGDILINLDSETEGELYVGCAGGLDATASIKYEMKPAPAGYKAYRISAKGMKGGHSGMDIILYRANANKVLARVLVPLLRDGVKLVSVDGGNMRNAIPREAYALCAVPMSDKEAVRVDLNIYLSDVENEFAVTEPNLQIELESESPCAQVMDAKEMKRFLLSIYAVHNGVYAMSQDIPGLVETSSNLASIKQGNGEIMVVTSQRSSILSSRKDMSMMVSSAFLLGGAAVTTGDGYPGWKPNPSSEILNIAVESYKRLFHVEPKVKAIHAGLECGLFLEKCPSLDMVSFGPTLRGVHSPDERMLIPTVDKFWRHLVDVLAHIPVKA